MTDGYDYEKAWEYAKKVKLREKNEEKRQEIAAQAAATARGQELAQQYLKQFRETGCVEFRDVRVSGENVWVACANAMMKELWPFGLLALLSSHYGTEYRIAIVRYTPGITRDPEMRRLYYRLHELKVE